MGYIPRSVGAQYDTGDQWRNNSRKYEETETKQHPVVDVPRDLPNPGIEPRFPVLQAESLPAEPQRSPRLLEWVACPFSSRSSQPRNQARVSCIAGGFFTN